MLAGAEIKAWIYPHCVGDHNLPEEDLEGTVNVVKGLGVSKQRVTKALPNQRGQRIAGEAKKLWNYETTKAHPLP